MTHRYRLIQGPINELDLRSLYFIEDSFRPPVADPRDDITHALRYDFGCIATSRPLTEAEVSQNGLEFEGSE